MKKILFLIFILSVQFLKAQINIAPQATVSASSCMTGACATLNDLNFGTCGTQQMWITSAATNPGSTIFIQFSWSSTQIINRLRIHAAQDLTRFLGGGTIQFWNGTTWVNHFTFTQTTGVCNYTIDFPAVVTTQIRIVDIVVIGSQSSNVNFREIEVFGPEYRNDAGVLFISNPDLCNSSQSIDATIINFGRRRLDSVRLNWSINGVQQATQYLTTSLTTGQTSVINLVNPFNFSPSTNYDIQVWTTFPNGAATDSGAVNDRFRRLVEFLGNPNPPTVADIVQCGHGNVNLNATPDNAGDSILWFTNSSGGVPIAIGKNAKGPYITSSKTYYAQAAKISQKNYKLSNFVPSTGVNVTQASDYGAMFNVTVTRDVVLDSLLFKLWYATPTNPGYQLYYKAGTFAGFTNTASAWTKLSEGIANFIVGAGGNMARVSANKVFLPAGTYSFYFTFDINLGSGNSLNSLAGGAAVSNSDLTFQNNSSILIGKFGTGTILTNYTIAMEALYKAQCVNTTRLQYNVTVKPRPIGAQAIKGSVFNGQFRAGVINNPDVAEVGKTISYEISPPTGFTNGGHGTTWIINSVSARTSKGVLIPATDYTVSPPTSSNNGRLTFTPKLAHRDSLIIFSMNYSDLGPHFCDSTVTRAVYVAATPFANFSFSGQFCQDALITFDNLSTIHSGFMSYAWYFDNGDTSDFVSPTVSYPAFGCYNVRLRATNEIWKNYKDTIIQICISQNPIIDFKNQNNCEGKAIVLKNNTTVGTGSLTYKWDFGDGTTLNTTSNADINKLYTTYGSYKVTLIAASNGCSATLTKNVYQFEKPKPNFNQISGVCSNDNFEFVSSTILNTANYGTKWDFDDNGNISTELRTVYKFNNAGTRNVKLTATSDFACKDSITKPILVKQSPKSDYSYLIACEKSPTQFQNTSNLFGETLNAYQWNIDGAINTATSPIVNWSIVGIKTVKLKTTLTNGCSDEISKNVEVKFQPTSDFEFENQCVGNEAVFTNLTKYRNGTVNYKWFFGDGSQSTVQSPTYTYNSGLSYTVKLVSSIVDGCQDSIEKVINISPLPSTCDFNYNVDWTKGYKSFNFTPTGGSLSNNTYTWLMGDGNKLISNSAGTDYTYKSDIRYCVTMIASNQAGCECSQTKCFDVFTGVNQLNKDLIKVYPNPNNGNFALSFDGSIQSPTIKVYNNLGQLVFEQNYETLDENINLNLSHLSKGVYSISISGKEFISVQTIVIQ